METLASIMFIERDLERISDRIKRKDWLVEHNNLFVTVIIKQRHSGLLFKLLLYCKGYPRKPIEATFVAINKNPIFILWPDDKENMFRIHTSGNKIPFICMAGLMSYSPEGDTSQNPYSIDDISIATIITQISAKINSITCTSFEWRIPNV